MNWVPSPHFDARPNENDISLLVIHNISLPPNQFGGDDIIDFFQGKLQIVKHPFYQQIKGVRVSAHCLIDRNGVITQFVNFEKRAWHAGMSSFQGRSCCNDFSIGIELEGTDFCEFTDAQYQALICLTDEIRTQYPAITLGKIVGHNDIAPGRKSDPGPFFDWCRYRTGLMSV